MKSSSMEHAPTTSACRRDYTQWLQLDGPAGGLQTWQATGKDISRRPLETMHLASHFEMLGKPLQRHACKPSIEPKSGKPLEKTRHDLNQAFLCHHPHSLTQAGCLSLPESCWSQNLGGDRQTADQCNSKWLQRCGHEVLVVCAISIVCDQVFVCVCMCLVLVRSQIAGCRCAIRVH